MPENSVYKSKVDLFLAIIIIMMIVLGLFFAGLGIWKIATNAPGYGWSLGTGIFTLLLIISMVWPVYYVLENDRLIIRFGWFRSKINYEIISGIKPSSNLLSSPALSVDKIRINYKGKVGFVLISPNNKEEFMKDLASRTKHLEYKNGIVSEK